jgi:hypothetical protein
MSKKLHMTEPVTVRTHPKNAGVRHFVFVMMVTSATMMGFFQAGHMNDGPVTQIAAEISEKWHEVIEHTARNLPKLPFGE